MALPLADLNSISRQESPSLLGIEDNRSNNESDASTTHLLDANTTLSTMAPVVAPKTQKNWFSASRGFMLDTWAVEIACTALGVCCLASTCVILAYYHDRPLTNLAGGLTLNTIVSILSTASRSAMMSVVSTTISQLKWCWLKDQARQLQSMQTIDGASRGPSGSLSLLFSLEGGLLASLGATITLLSLAYGPSLQRVVEYPTRNATAHPSVAVASVPQVLNYTVPFGLNVGSVSDNELKVALEFDAAVAVGIWSQPDSFQPEVGCPSGNCTWPRFKSVGWCSKCKEVRPPPLLDDCDIVPWLADPSRPAPRCSLNLNQGSATDIISVVSATPLGFNVSSNIYFTVRQEVVWVVHQSEHSKGNTSSTYLDVDNPLLVLGRAKIATSYLKDFDDDGDRFDLTVEEAEQCVLSLCERDYELVTHNGVTSIREDNANFGSTYMRIVTVPAYYTETEDQTYLCWQPDSRDANITGLGEKVVMVDEQNRAFCPVDIYVAPLVENLTGNVTAPWRRFSMEGEREYYMSQDSEHSADEIQFSSDSMRALSSYQKRASHLEDGSEVERRTMSMAVPPMVLQLNYTRAAYHRSLRDQLEGVAASLTNWGFRNTHTKISGTVYVPEVYVSVNWRWLVLPAGIQLASVILMVFTIWQSRRTDIPPWKGSLLPVLFHGLKDGSIGRDPALERVSGMERTAEDVTVGLTSANYEERSVIRRRPKVESKEDCDA